LNGDESLDTEAKNGEKMFPVNPKVKSLVIRWNHVEVLEVGKTAYSLKESPFSALILMELGELQFSCIHRFP
jgi:hypothetical protein